MYVVKVISPAGRSVGPAPGRPAGERIQAGREGLPGGQKDTRSRRGDAWASRPTYIMPSYSYALLPFIAVPSSNGRAGFGFCYKRPYGVV